MPWLALAALLLTASATRADYQTADAARRDHVGYESAWSASGEAQYPTFAVAGMAAASSAGADLAVALGDSSEPAGSAGLATPGLTAITDPVGLSDVVDLVAPFARVTPNLREPVVADPAAGNSVELPPPPDGRAIVLTSLLAMGAYRLARQARNLHLAPLPEWYHAGAPEQVGHATVLDLAGSRDLVPVCWYEPIIAETSSSSPVAYTRWRERPSRCQSTYFIPTTAPRSPPRLTSDVLV